MSKYKKWIFGLATTILGVALAWGFGWVATGSGIARENKVVLDQKIPQIDKNTEKIDTTRDEIYNRLGNIEGKLDILIRLQDSAVKGNSNVRTKVP